MIALNQGFSVSRWQMQKSYYWIGLVFLVLLLLISYVYFEKKTDKVNQTQVLNPKAQCSLFLKKIENNIKRLGINQSNHTDAMLENDIQISENELNEMKNNFVGKFKPQDALNNKLLTCGSLELKNQLVCPRFRSNAKSEVLSQMAYSDFISQELSMPAKLRPWLVKQDAVAFLTEYYDSEDRKCNDDFQLVAKNFRNIKPIWKDILRLSGIDQFKVLPYEFYTKLLVVKESTAVSNDIEVESEVLEKPRSMDDVCVSDLLSVSRIAPIAKNKPINDTINSFEAADYSQLFFENKNKFVLDTKLRYWTDQGNWQECKSSIEIAFLEDTQSPSLSTKECDQGICLSYTEKWNADSLPIYCGNILSKANANIPNITASFIADKESVFYACRLEYEGLSANSNVNNFGQAPFEYQDSGWFSCLSDEEYSFEAGVDPNTVDPNRPSASFASNVQRAKIKLQSKISKSNGAVQLNMSGFAEGYYRLSVKLIDAARNVSAMDYNNIVGSNYQIRFGVDLNRPVISKLPISLSQNIVGSFNSELKDPNYSNYFDPQLYPELKDIFTKFEDTKHDIGMQKKLYQCSSTIDSGVNAEWEIPSVYEMFPVADIGAKWWFGKANQSIKNVLDYLHSDDSLCEMAKENIMRKRPKIGELNVNETDEYMIVARACDLCGMRPDNRAQHALRSWYASLSAKNNSVDISNAKETKKLELVATQPNDNQQECTTVELNSCGIVQKKTENNKVKSNYYSKNFGAFLAAIDEEKRTHLVCLNDIVSCPLLATAFSDIEKCQVSYSDCYEYKNKNKIIYCGSQVRACPSDETSFHNQAECMRKHLESQCRQISPNLWCGTNN